VGDSFSVTASAQVSEGLIGEASVSVTWTGGGIFGGGAYTGIVSSGGAGDCGYKKYIFPYYAVEGNFECEDEKDRTVRIIAYNLDYSEKCSKETVVHCNKPSYPSCSCGSWSNQGCGLWICNDNQMYQTRSCNPPGCSTERRCVSSSSCTLDPCAGVSCGSCQYCSDGNCYYYCSGTSSSCGCTSCTNCGSCAYCSNYNCYNYCSGTDTSCGCTSCTNCNTLDNWYNKGSTYPCCDLTNPDVKCTCQDQEYRDHYCSGGSCDSYTVTNNQTIRSNCNDCGYCKTCSNGVCIDKPGVKGTVTNVSIEKIKGAEVKILGLGLSDTTDENGNYFICDFPAGTYDIVASKQGFEPGIKKLDFDGTNIVMNFDFVLYTAGSDCKPDCSKTTDEKPRCHADCDGINGCRFYDQRTKELCTVPYSRVVNVLESYNSTHKLLCCDGEPYLYPKISGDQLVFPESEHHVKITRIVFFRGKFARMIIDLFV